MLLKKDRSKKLWNEQIKLKQAIKSSLGHTLSPPKISKFSSGHRISFFKLVRNISKFPATAQKIGPTDPLGSHQNCFKRRESELTYYDRVFNLEDLMVA